MNQIQLINSDSKPHYALLDGLRGVAALLVVWYHIFEGYQFAGGKPIIDFANHGYLAVDFFFILSGFVVGYAYDSRWPSSHGDYGSGDWCRQLCTLGVRSLGWQPIGHVDGYVGAAVRNVHDTGGAGADARSAWQR